MRRWEGYELICPDLDKNEINIKGDPSTDMSSYLKFQISLCQTDCPDDLADYISDLQVDVWASYEKIDYSKKHGKPV